jgi:cytoskeletal protein CcmA (bactofilin family)
MKQTKLINQFKYNDMSNENSGNAILIPDETLIEGFIKTKKSFRIESLFYGTLLSTEKVIIDSTSTVKGDIVCSELSISGSFEGNIYCTGKFSVTGNAKIKGQVFTKLFQNEENCDLNCFIQIPNNAVINAIMDILVNISSSTKLSTDINLKKITELFNENVYTAKDESKKIKPDEIVTENIDTTESV